MKKVIILFLLICFCGGSSESKSTQPQQDQELSQDGISEKVLKESKQIDSNEQTNSSSSQESKNQIQSNRLTIQTLPDIKEFQTNKSDRFFVDFEDIIAGHPYVGKRSPRPHNDAQVYFQIQIQDGERQQNHPIFPHLCCSRWDY